MRLKPKNTALNPKALLYKRFVGLEKSTALGVVFATILQNQTTSYWVFDRDLEDFVNIPQNVRMNKVIHVDGNSVFAYKDKKYIFRDDKWQEADSGSYELLSTYFAPTSEYQTNKYYFVGSFDYMIKGGIEGTTSQQIKGNILPLDSLNIRYYTDELSIQRDDMVVIDDRLFFVEDTELVQKRMPKKFNIYSSTLNNIL